MADSKEGSESVRRILQADNGDGITKSTEVEIRYADRDDRV